MKSFVIFAIGQYLTKTCTFSASGLLSALTENFELARRRVFFLFATRFSPIIYGHVDGSKLLYEVRIKKMSL